jgi:VIT1/CCC1 family predicted Fe2+/Mn2+ transporter
MKSASIVAKLKSSLVASAGTVVFGMMDGTVSIFGLIFGVAATTSSNAIVLIAGASGAAAAAVSMMAGAYLDAETTRDEVKANQASLQADLALDPTSIGAKLTERLTKAGVPSGPATALSAAVQRDPEALAGLRLAVQAAQEAQLNPGEQALWMLFADLVSATVPILPFALAPDLAGGSSQLR